MLLLQVKVEDCDIQDKESMLFAGTAISNGSCLGIVNSIGMQTEIGKIQQQIQEAAEEEEDSPLKKKIDNFGERLAQVSLREIPKGQVLCSMFDMAASYYATSMSLTCPSLHLKLPSPSHHNARSSLNLEHPPSLCLEPACKQQKLACMDWLATLIPMLAILHDTSLFVLLLFTLAGATSALLTFLTTRPLLS